MTVMIECECGWESCAETRAELLAAMRAHVTAEHPEVVTPPIPRTSSR